MGSTIAGTPPSLTTHILNSNMNEKQQYHAQHATKNSKIQNKKNRAPFSLGTQELLPHTATLGKKHRMNVMSQQWSGAKGRVFHWNSALTNAAIVQRKLFIRFIPIPNQEEGSTGL